MRVLELFAGIGGCAAAVAGRAEVVGAVDHDRRAAEVYAANHPAPVHVKNLVSVKARWLAGFEADLWWLSPPCAPHGIRGAQADLEDRRSDALVALLPAIAELGPRFIAVENVPWFLGSRAHEALAKVLADAGYAVTEGLLCPSELGLPVVRRRAFVIAGREGVRPWGAPAVRRQPLSDFVGPWREDLAVPEALLERFGGALHVVDADDPAAVAACFTRAYGRSPVYVGSYLRQAAPDGPRLRYFAPEEIGALHGLPRGFTFGDLPPRLAWRLVGNGVSSDVVRHVLGALGLDGSAGERQPTRGVEDHVGAVGA